MKSYVDRNKAFEPKSIVFYKALHLMTYLRKNLC